MCVIIYKPASVPLSTEVITAAWYANPDGAGFAYTAEKDVYLSKGYMDLPSLLFALDQHDWQKQNLLLHFRIRTHGTVNAANTQPFALDHLDKLDEHTPMAFAHNGIIDTPWVKNPAKSRPGESDTAIFAQDVLAPLCRGRLSKVLDRILQSAAHKSKGKFAILTAKGINLYGDWKEYSGLYFSNMYWQDMILDEFANDLPCLALPDAEQGDCASCEYINLCNDYVNGERDYREVLQ